MPDSHLLLVALIAVALIFDFLNGLHDAANSIATVVSTRVLSPNVAVVWAAFFNFVAFLFFGLHVAQTVGTGIISPDIVDGQVIFGALMGAIVWNVLTWWGAIPSSSSHALIGGLIGAGAAKAGFSAVVWWGTLKTVAAIDEEGVAPTGKITSLDAWDCRDFFFCLDQGCAECHCAGGAVVKHPVEERAED